MTPRDASAMLYQLSNQLFLLPRSVGKALHRHRRGRALSSNSVDKQFTKRSTP